MATPGENLTSEIERRPKPGLPQTAARYVRRVSHTARNVAEVVRFGGLETDEEQSPYVVAAEQPNYRLRHYFADDVAANATPVLLVPPLMMTAEVWDVSPATSGVAALHTAGHDAWVVDFGHPDREPGGLERNLTDHVLAVSDAVERVVAATSAPVVLSGYSQGGMFAYQAAAYRRGKDIDSLITFGSPVDTTAPLPIPIAPDVVARLAGDLVDSGLLRKVAVPEWFVRLGFKLLDPAKAVQGRVQFLLALNDRAALLPRERQRQFLDREGWTAYSGPAIAELLEQFVTHNRMLEGGFVIDDRLVTLADIDLPIFTVVGQKDTLGHPDSVRAIRRAAPRADIYELTLPGGHFGLVVGSTATATTWPAVSDWLQWRAGAKALPDSIQPADTVVPGRTARASAAAVAVAQATELGVGMSRAALTTARRGLRAVRGVAREAPSTLPRLARIEHLAPSTRISLGQLLDEQARRAPHDVAFLFGDRAYRQHDVKYRVDSVVKGLISIGVRPGDQVGVLMTTRPSAFTVVTALSRLGATAVLLRPDADIAREAQLGKVTWVVSDPDHISQDVTVEGIEGIRWAVLGGGGPEGGRQAFWREQHPHAIDMERIDPDDVLVPAWYHPNPHRAGDVAFVLFVGEGADTRIMPITNRRWALGALGTASAAALRAGDTVFSVTPIHHSSALLMSIGGAVASGARFAMTSSDDPQTFWAEVRRYGATHVSYTWTSLRAIVDAAPNPNEQYHPIKMFIGSGMPRHLWKRVIERFPGTRVLEFYASAAGEVVLANVPGKPVGSLGKPLPGSAEIRVAAFDLDAGAITVDAAGRGRECAADELGVLLARVDPAEESTGTPLRGVFADGDAWRSTGDLFLRDEYGDLWLAGPVSEVIHGPDGPVVASAARLALGTLSAVDQLVTYGVRDGDADVLVAAMTLRAGKEVTGSAISKALVRLPAVQRPRYVQVVESIPVTTWHRPVWRALQEQGVPVPSAQHAVWRRDGADYEPVQAHPRPK